LSLPEISQQAFFVKKHRKPDELLSFFDWKYFISQEIYSISEGKKILYV